jgi:hypothetical protein
VNNRLQFVPKMHRVSARWQVYPAMHCEVQLLLQTVGLTATRDQVIKGCRAFEEPVTGSFDREPRANSRKKKRERSITIVTAVHCQTCAATLQHRCQGPLNTTQQCVFSALVTLLSPWRFQRQQGQRLSCVPCCALGASSRISRWCYSPGSRCLHSSTSSTSAVFN